MLCGVSVDTRRVGAGLLRDLGDRLSLAVEDGRRWATYFRTFMRGERTRAAIARAAVTRILSAHVRHAAHTRGATKWRVTVVPRHASCLSQLEADKIAVKVNV
jgi:hypothetical protein